MNIEKFFDWSLTNKKEIKYVSPIFHFSPIERITMGIIGKETNISKIKDYISANIDLDDVCEVYINKSNIIYDEDKEDVYIITLLRSFEFYKRNDLLLDDTIENPDCFKLEYDDLTEELNYLEKKWIIDNINLEKLFKYFDYTQ